MFFRMMMNFMMYRMMIDWMVRHFMVMNRVMRLLFMWVMQRFHNNLFRSVVKNRLVRRRVMGRWMMRIFWYRGYMMDKLVVDMLCMDMVRNIWWAIMRFRMVMSHMVFHWRRGTIVRLRFMVRMVGLRMMNFLMWVMVMMNGMMFGMVFNMRRLVMVNRLKDNFFNMVFWVNNPGPKVFRMGWLNRHMVVV